MESWSEDIEYERLNAVKRLTKKLLINPVANYMPATVMRALLRFGKSELAAANWADPGGWRSMVISYEGAPTQIADKLLVGGGTISMALRNRKRLGSRVIARLIDQADRDSAHVLCLGAGPGMIVLDAMRQAGSPSHATLVDINPDAFDHGRTLAAELGLSDRVRFVEADVREIEPLLETPPDIVKLLGILEYIDDEMVTSIAEALAEVMPAGAAVVTNSISKAHGTDRFFRRVLGLRMIHRSPERIRELLEPSGIGEFTSIPEPLGVYHVLVGRRMPRLACPSTRGAERDG